MVEARALRAQWTAADRSRLQGKRVLYVDDDPLFRRAVSRLLYGAGASCQPAPTHDAAVTILAGDPQLDLAILDFHMPDGPVASLVPRLRAVRPGLLLVGTSGGNRRREFADCGVPLFIAKPWILGDLVQVASW